MLREKSSTTLVATFDLAIKMEKNCLMLPHILYVGYTCDFDHKDRACHDKPFIITKNHGNSNIRQGSKVLKKTSKEEIPWKNFQLKGQGAWNLSLPK